MPKVSVSIITFNHEQYIAQAIESVLMQKTSFDFEVLIGEDDSEDNTREIVKEYERRYPEKIRLFLNDRKNVIYIDGRATGRWNMINNLKHARGEYVALLEGDDYWTDPYKLQKQIDFLDSRQEYVICFHWTKWLDEEGGKIRDKMYGPSFINYIKPYYTIDDLLEHANFIPTNSVVFRNGLLNGFPEWFYKVPVGDFPLNVLNALHGKIGFLDEAMSVYRRHAGGVYGGLSYIRSLEIGIESYQMIGKNLNLNKRASFNIGISKWFIPLGNAYKKEGRYLKAIGACFKSIASDPRIWKRRRIEDIISIFFYSEQK